MAKACLCSTPYKQQWSCFKTPEEEIWLPNYIEKKLQRLVASGESETVLDELYMALGQDHYFDKIVTKTMLEILSVRLRSRESTEDEGMRRNTRGQVNNYVNETGDISAQEPMDTLEYSMVTSQIAFDQEIMDLN